MQTSVGLSGVSPYYPNSKRFAVRNVDCMLSSAQWAQTQKSLFIFKFDISNRVLHMSKHYTNLSESSIRSFCFNFKEVVKVIVDSFVVCFPPQSFAAAHSGLHVFNVHPFKIPNPSSTIRYLYLVGMQMMQIIHWIGMTEITDKCVRTKYIFLLTVRCSPNTFCGCSLLSMVWQQVNFLSCGWISKNR